MDISQWRLDMIGLVAVAKPEGSWEVEFYPTERLPMEEGDVNVTKDISTVVKDLKGNSNTSSGERKSKLTAVWIPGGADGRQTPPDVQPGEMLEIWRFADSERYFWKTYKNNPTLRRLEHVVYAFVNLTAFGVKMSIDSSYGYCFSTLNKIVSIWTSKSDGEAFKYNFDINTRNSTVRLGDDVDNSFAINSEENEVYMKNGDDSYLNLYGQYMSGYASRQICLKSDRVIKLLAPSVTIGGRGNCSNEPSKISDWHPYTHVYANDEENHASIGNKYDAYTDYKDNDITVVAKGNVATNAKAVETSSETNKTNAVLVETSSETNKINASKEHSVETPLAKFSEDMEVGGNITAESVDVKRFYLNGTDISAMMTSMGQTVRDLEAKIKELEEKG